MVILSIDINDGRLDNMLEKNYDEMPRFIWVCELYRVSDYDKLMAFGEIVIDATSAPNRGHRSLILMHYPMVVAYRSPNQTEVGFDEMAELEYDQLFPGYVENIDKINGCFAK